MKIILFLLCFLIAGCLPKYIEGPVTTPSDFTVNQVIYSDEIHRKLDLYVDSFINNKDILVSSIDGYDIAWSVLKGNAHIENNIIYKHEDADEYEEIELIANVNGVEYTFDNIELLDEYVGYLMTYFTGDERKNEKMFYAWTYNGLLWYQINKQAPVLSANIGTRRLRDPSVVRLKNGNFVVLATHGYDNSTIYAFDTNNLVDFENERMIEVNNTDDLSKSQAWAPEAFYDRRIDKIIIYWSSPNDGKMFYNYSNNLEDIGYAETLIDVGFPVIDGTLLKEDFGYSIVLKDERSPMEEHSQLFVGYGNDFNSIDNFDFNYFSGHQSEGPFIVRRGYDYLLYYDDYTRHKFKAFQFFELKANVFEEIDDEDIISSINNLKHGSAIPLTWKEYERIKAKYDMGEN